MNDEMYSWKGIGTIVACILGAIAFIVFGWFLARSDWNYRDSQIFHDQAVEAMVERDKVKQDYDRQASIVYELDKENKRLVQANIDLERDNGHLKGQVEQLTAAPTPTPRPAPSWGGPGDDLMYGVTSCLYSPPDEMDCIINAVNRYLRATGRQ